LKGVLGEVGVVIDNEIVASTKKVEVAQPGEIVGLQNGYGDLRTHRDAQSSDFARYLEAADADES